MNSVLSFHLSFAFTFRFANLVTIMLTCEEETVVGGDNLRRGKRARMDNAQAAWHLHVSLSYLPSERMCCPNISI